MQRALHLVIISSIIIFGATFAGMSVFGMDPGMAMDHGMSGVECVNHCVSKVPISIPSTSAPMAAFVILLTASVLPYLTINVGQTGRPARRWHSDIGKNILHQNLATVVLRN